MFEIPLKDGSLPCDDFVGDPICGGEGDNDEPAEYLTGDDSEIKEMMASCSSLLSDDDFLWFVGLCVLLLSLFSVLTANFNPPLSALRGELLDPLDTDADGAFDPIPGWA